MQVKEKYMGVQKTAIVILGASGDLAQRKLVPALDILFKQGKLDSTSIVVGSGRSVFTHETFRDRFSISTSFAQQLYYHQSTKGLKQFIASLGSFQRVVFFFSLPPNVYASTAQEIVNEGFGSDASIIIEKPFGYDYASAAKLNKELGCCFSENQIYRIDHYLAKEAVQNIMVFRFANALFYPVWNSRNIASIQISATEPDTIFERGPYFDHAGIIRDMVQNHLLQLLCLITMEAPLSLAPEDIRVQKIHVLRTLKVEQCYRYQYRDYRNERGVDSQSTTETFAEMKLTINNFRWIGVPVYIRTGKALHRRGIDIGIQFKTIPRLLFNEKGTLPPNNIVFKIQPAEGIILDIQSKIPGTDDSITRSTMNFCYRDSFVGAIPEAYQRLLYDVLRQDHTLFVSALESEAAWKVIEPSLDRGPVEEYTPGTMPASRLDVDWIDFDSYQGLCS